MIVVGHISASSVSGSRGAQCLQVLQYSVFVFVNVTSFVQISGNLAPLPYSVSPMSNGKGA